jgi:hypothetical protein
LLSPLQIFEQVQCDEEMEEEEEATKTMIYHPHSRHSIRLQAEDLEGAAEKETSTSSMGVCGRDDGAEDCTQQ